MNPPMAFNADGVLRRWVDKRTGEDVENLLKWRKTTEVSWSRASDLYPAKVWVHFFVKSGEKAKLWLSFDSDEEAEQAFEKADSLRDAYLRSPAGNAAHFRPQRSPQSNSQRKLEAEDLRLPSIETLGEPPEYDPSDNPF